MGIRGSMMLGGGGQLQPHSPLELRDSSLPPTDFLLRPPPPPQPTVPAALPENQGTKSPARGVPGWRLGREGRLKKVWTRPAELWLQPGPAPDLLMNVQFEKEIADTQPGSTHCRLHGFIQPSKNLSQDSRKTGQRYFP